MEELKLADSKGDYSTTWKIIHDLSGRSRLRSRWETALLLKVTKIFLQNGRNTSALFSTMIMVKPHLICHKQLLRTCQSMITTYTWGDIGSHSQNEDEQGSRTWLCYYRRSSPGWRWCNGRCYPLLLCCGVLKSDTTWPVDHQRHCLSTQEGWPEPYDQL